MPHRGDRYRWTRLENGVLVVTRSTTSFRRVTGIVGSFFGANRLDPLRAWLNGQAKRKPPEEMHRLCSGLLHLLEHLLGERTRNLSPTGARMIRDIVAANAFTEYDNILTYFDCRPPEWRSALAFNAEVWLNTRFRRGSLNSEISAIRDELRLEEATPETLRDNRFSEVLWRGSDFAYTPLQVRGLSTVPLSVFRRYLREATQGRRLAIGLVGDIDHEEVLDAVRAHFGACPPGDPPVSVKAKGQSGIAVHHLDTRTVFFKLGWGVPGYVSRDFYAGQVLSTLLGNLSSGGIGAKLRQQGLSYSVSADLSLDARLAEFVFAGTIAESSAHSSMEDTVRAVRNLPDLEIDPVQLQLARDVTIGYFERRVDNPYDDLRHTVDSLMRSGRYRGITHEIERIERVTADDLIEYADRHLQGQPALALVCRKGAFRITRGVRQLFGELALKKAA